MTSQSQKCGAEKEPLPRPAAPSVAGPLAAIERAFGRRVSRLSVPGSIHGVQVIEVRFANGQEVRVEGPSHEAVWSTLFDLAPTRAAPLPGFGLIAPIIPDWNDLTNAQRVAICDRAEYWDCEECSPISRDAAHGMYQIIREVLGVGLADTSERQGQVPGMDQSKPTDQAS